MSLATLDFLRNTYNAARAMGDKAVSSDATIVVPGYEDLALLIKQFPWPVISPMGEIEIATPMGGMAYQPQVMRMAHQGAFSIYETEGGHAQQFFTRLFLENGGRFNRAVLYEGTQERFRRALVIVDGFFVVDPADRDMENRAQAVMFTGTMFFHHFGEIIPGNV